VGQQYQGEFIQHQLLNRHLAAFLDGRNYLSWGHLMFADRTAVAVGRVRHILLVRDPHDWVIAQARFFLSDAFEGGVEFLKEKTLSVGAILNMMIFGIAEKTPPLASTYAYNALAWLGTGVHLVRYEDLIGAIAGIDGKDAERFFQELLDACGIERPADWRKRIVVGSDRKQSGTARENLTGIGVELPSRLPDIQKQMIDFAAPHLREILGYK
jgi:hypothetical protein